MLNQVSLSAVAASTAGPGLVRPAYGGYCFAGLPDTLLGLFGLPAHEPLPAAALPVARARRVVLVLLDAFGWSLFERWADHAPFLRRMLAEGVVSQLTAQFPSTTAAHLTCLHTGQALGQSGVHEWFYYEPEVDAIIAPLLYSFAGDTERDRLARFGVRPEALFPPPLYPQLAAAGVTAFVFQLRDYARSAYSRWITRGAHMAPYATLPEALANLEARLESAPAPAYFLLYVDALDTHHYGPGSRQVEAEARAVFRLLDDFVDDCRRRFPDTLLLITADHGQVPADPARTLYLNQRLPELRRWLRTDRRGRPLLFGGSARDLFLYVQDQHLEEAQARLSAPLAGQARVQLTAALLDAGLFGPAPVAGRLRERLGNLAVLPEAEQIVYWLEPGRFEQKLRGHHGGLTPAEMLIPFMACEL
jgi:hypothetical protein